MTAGFTMVETKYNGDTILRGDQRSNTIEGEIHSYLRTENRRQMFGAVLLATAITMASPAAKADVNTIRQSDNSANIYRVISDGGYGVSLSFLNRYAYSRFDYKQVSVAQSNISGNVIDYGFRIGYPVKISNNVLIVPYLAFNEQRSSWTVIEPVQTQTSNNPAPTTTPPTTTPPTTGTPPVTTPPTTTPPTTTPPTTVPPRTKGKDHDRHGNGKQCKDPDYKNHGNERNGRDADDGHHESEDWTSKDNNWQNQKDNDNGHKRQGDESHGQKHHGGDHEHKNSKEGRSKYHDGANNNISVNNNPVSKYLRKSFDSVDAIVESITNPFTQFSSTSKEDLGSAGVILQYSPDSKVVISNEVEVGEVFNSTTNTPFGTYNMPNSMFEGYGIKLNYLVPVSKEGKVDFFMAGQIMHMNSPEIIMGCQTCSNNAVTYSSTVPINTMYEIGIGYSFR